MSALHLSYEPKFIIVNTGIPKRFHARNDTDLWDRGSIWEHGVARSGLPVIVACTFRSGDNPASASSIDTCYVIRHISTSLVVSNDGCCSQRSTCGKGRRKHLVAMLVRVTSIGTAYILRRSTPRAVSNHGCSARRSACTGQGTGAAKSLRSTYALHAVGPRTHYLRVSSYISCATACLRHVATT